MVGFGRYFDEAGKNAIQDKGFNGPAGLAVGWLRLIWCHWLAPELTEDVKPHLQKLVAQGIELLTSPPRLGTEGRDPYYIEWRGRHDLYLLHCAIFGSDETQLKALAEKVIDASGVQGQKPEERNGELYASAYTGMLKYWILGDLDKATEQSEVIWKAYKDNSFGAAAKSLVSPWLKQDWKAFHKAQHKDFERLWGRIRKSREVMTENGEETVINSLLDLPVTHFWCWAHCGLALLAHRRYGIEIVTDPLLFPAQALKAVPKS